MKLASGRGTDRKDLAPADRSPGPLEIPGACYICGNETLVRTCAMCGGSVCKAHFHFAASGCIRCARRTPRGGRGPQPDEAPDQPGPEDIGGRFT